MRPTLLHIIPSNIWSGRERYALDICRHFESAGWDTAVLTRDARVVDTPFEECGVRIFHCPFNGFLDITSTRRLARLMRGMPRGVPAVVHAHRGHDALRAIAARRLALRPDIRVVLTRHKVEPGHDSLPYRLLYSQLDSMIFVSQRVADVFLSTWSRRDLPMAAERMSVLLNSVMDAPEALTPLPKRGPVTAMFQGPLQPGKGLETLIDALRLLRGKGVKLRMRIMGNGNPDYVDGLRRRAQQLGVMEMIDWRRHDPWPMPMIGDAHFGVMPSAVAEAFCLANAEFMAMGRPVVCTATGAQPEYMESGRSALFVPPATAAPLAEAMARLASDAGLRTKMGDEAFDQFNRRIPWAAFADRLEQIYRADT